MDLGLPLSGRLLVATPPLVDPNFDRTVVLVLEHTAEGAVGVVLNRPSDTPVAEALPEWAPLAAEPAAVFIGGPVAVGSAIGLALATGPIVAGEAWAPVDGLLGTVDLALDPADVEPPVERLRVFTGYAGWDAGQLEHELEEGAWLVADAAPGDCHTRDPEGLWPAVLRRQGGRTAWLANFPPDPRLN